MRSIKCQKSFKNLVSRHEQFLKTSNFYTKKVLRRENLGDVTATNDQRNFG